MADLNPSYVAFDDSFEILMLSQSFASQWQEWVLVFTYLSITMLVIYKVVTSKPNS